MLWVWVKGNGPPLWSARSPALDYRVCYHFQINLRLPHGESLCVFICVTFHMWSVLSVMWQHIIQPLFKYWNALRKHISVYVYCFAWTLDCIPRSPVGLYEFLFLRFYASLKINSKLVGVKISLQLSSVSSALLTSEYQGTNKQTGTNQRMNSLKNCFILAYRIKASAAEWVCCSGYLKKSIRICKRTVQGLLDVL